MQPFKEAVRRCEGDYVTLHQVQETIDFLRDRLTERLATKLILSSFTPLLSAGMPSISTID